MSLLRLHQRLLARLVASLSMILTLSVVLYAGITSTALSPELYAFIGGITGAAATFLWSK